MLKTFTALALMTALLGAAVGIGAHQNEGFCPIPNLPDCCKKAQSAGNTPDVSMARLCCNLNCSEPGSGGSGGSASISSQQNTTPTAIVLPNAAPANASTSLRYPPPFNPYDSSPKYIQHLALLI